MSESSIKRLMTANDASLNKIEEICDYIGISFFDLIETCKDEELTGLKLTQEQSFFFSMHTNYFYLFHLLYEEKQSVSQIQKRFKVNELSMNRYLKKLEDLNLLEWHPGNRLVFLVKGAIELESGSPLAKHVLNASMKNLTSIVTGDRKNSKKEGLFQFRETHLTEASINRIIESFNGIVHQLEIDASREEKIYDIEELDFYTINFGVLPQRLYCEDIPNI